MSKLVLPDAFEIFRIGMRNFKTEENEKYFTGNC